MSKELCNRSKIWELISEFYKEHDSSRVEITGCIRIATRIARLMKDYENLLWLELTMMDISNAENYTYEEFSNQSDMEEFFRHREKAFAKLKYLKQDPNEMIRKCGLELLIAFPMDIDGNLDNQTSDQLRAISESCKKVVYRIKNETYNYVDSVEQQFI